MLPAIAFIMHFRQADPDSGKTDLSDERFDLSREQPYLFITDPEVQALIPDQANFFGGGDKLCCIATFEGANGKLPTLNLGRAGEQPPAFYADVPQRSLRSRKSAGIRGGNPPA
jgi:hypothetical protein